jgi:hypothetical protein
MNIHQKHQATATHHDLDTADTFEGVIKTTIRHFNQNLEKINLKEGDKYVSIVSLLPISCLRNVESQR